MSAIESIAGYGLPLFGDNIDTDQIIPGRFLKCVTFDSLAEGLFYDSRFESNGNAKAHPMNTPKYEDASILITGNNFGCGSSREHAPQALQKSGFKAIIAGSFAEIFFGNCTTLGIPCVTMEEGFRLELMAQVESNSTEHVKISLEELVVKFGEWMWPISMKESARLAFLKGSFDPLSELLSRRAKVESLEQQLPHVWDLS